MAFNHRLSVDVELKLTPASTEWHRVSAHGLVTRIVQSADPSTPPIEVQLDVDFVVVIETGKIVPMKIEKLFELKHWPWRFEHDELVRSCCGP